MSADYFLEIEAHFISRRGTPFVLNAKDVNLIREWHDAGIPLPIVIEAIDAVFDKQEAKEKKVNGLSFCKYAVKELWAERRELQVGSESVTPEEDPAARLEALALALESSPASSYAARVRELAREKSVPKIEEALMALEEELMASLATDALRAEAAALAAGVDEKSRARSEEAHLRRLVREELQVPRLTVF